MAASFSNMLIIPSSKITYGATLGSSFHKFPTAPSPLKRKQKAIKLVTRDNSSPLVADLVGEIQEPEHATTPPQNEIRSNTYYNYKPKDLSEVWREIHGKNDWAGLLEPMDPLLRSEVIRYGEMAEACYDAFDYDEFSKYCGTCRFEEEELFSSLGMSQHGYNVTRYIHLTANSNLFDSIIQSGRPSPKVNWGGYVAVSDDATSCRLGRRDITIAWRGTVTYPEMIEDAICFPIPVTIRGIPWYGYDPSVEVEFGFLNMYTGKNRDSDYCKEPAREHVLAEVKRLLEKYRNEQVSITLTGHSLGSALAILSAFDIVETRANGDVPVSVMSFSGPMVGNDRFCERLEKLGVKVLRVVNVHDLVPSLPGTLPIVGNSYSHVGVKLELDHTKSPFLNPTQNNPKYAHNLEVLLHLLDGYHGKDKNFELTSRDPVLVNKYCDFLKDSYMVPPTWWQCENKGLKIIDGRWRQPDRKIYYG